MKSDNSKEVDKPLKREGVYQSSKLREREERILQVTKDLLAEVGYEQMTMGEAAKRAGVARATLYNAYKNKENLAVLTIEDSLQQIRNTVSDIHPESGLDDILATNEAALEQMLLAPEYSREMARLLFRSELDNPITKLLFDEDETIPSLQTAQDKRQITDELSPEQIAGQMESASWGAILEWSMGTITDEELRVKNRLGLLLILYAVAKGRNKSLIKSQIEQVS